MSLLFPVNTKIPADTRWKTPPRARECLSHLTPQQSLLHHQLSATAALTGWGPLQVPQQKCWCVSETPGSSGLGRWRGMRSVASGKGKVGRRYQVKRQKWREGASRFLSRVAQDHSHLPHGWQEEACPLATPASPGRLISASSHALEFSTFCDKGTL